MKSLSLLLFLLISVSVQCAVSDEMKCTCSPCGSCPYQSPPPPEVVPPPPPPPSPPPPSPPPPAVWPTPPPTSPATPFCPPPPSEYPPPSEPISPYPPVSPSPPSPPSPYWPNTYGPPGVLYPVDPGYRPSGACGNWAGRWVVFVVGGLLVLWL